MAFTVLASAATLPCDQSYRKQLTNQVETELYEAHYQMYSIRHLAI
jgi:hypothetical protein